MESDLHVVTGAFSFTGSYIARRLLARGDRVRTLTNHPEREHDFGEAVSAFPLEFADPAALQDAMEGASTLFNTYWIRFQRGNENFDRAIANTEILLRAARGAGIQRVVHCSIVNAAEDSPLPYFRAKARAESVLRESGVPGTILRPTVLFGKESILFNNIAWLLRRFPIFAVAGDGTYRLQPVDVDDVAKQAVAALGDAPGKTFDVAGPETFTFLDLVRLVAQKTGRRRARILRVDPERMLGIINKVSGLVHDPVLTREELEGLTREMLLSRNDPVGETRFSDWLEAHGNILGRHYASGIQRHFR